MHGMMKMFTSVKDFYNEINGATLTGAIDVVVVEQPDGSFSCSPFHVRFGKLGVLRSREKVVDIEINGESQDIHMKLGESGEAFFVEELDDENEIPEHLATSPIPLEFESMFKAQGRRRSLDLGLEKPQHLENEVNDYSKRRYTADNENDKIRGRNFLQRQIGLGNIDVMEKSADELTLSMHSTKLSSEDLTNDLSETIFKMDSLDMDSSIKVDAPRDKDCAEPKVEGKVGKKKRKKMRKKNSARKVSTAARTEGLQAVAGAAIAAPQPAEGGEKISDTSADRSSLDSNGSDVGVQRTDKGDEVPKSTSVQEPAANIKMIDADFHFFSDTELTTNNAAESKAGTPIHVETVQSDSEFEVKVRKEDVTESSKSWEWGGFPSVSQTNSPTNETPSKEDQKSMLSGMFSFMKQKHSVQTQRVGPGAEGLYLSDINSSCIDPAIAELYFSTAKNDKREDGDMDCESGNGPSLTQSPNSREGCKSIDSDFDDPRRSQPYSQEIQLSLCGWEPEPTKTRFMENLVKFSDLCNNPTIFDNKSLVVRIGDKYYTWKVAAPMLASCMIFGRPLLQGSVDQLVHEHMPTNIVQKTDKETPKEEARSWWSWRRQKIRDVVPPTITETDQGSNSKLAVAEPSTTPAISTIQVETKEIVTPEQTTIELKASVSMDTSEALSEDKELEKTVSSIGDKCRKTLRLSSKQIASLNLRDGVNEIEFSVTTAYQGTTRCQCHLYKWKWDDKIVISDIDGTITRSDVLGHILPIVGKDWAQSGVAQLFNKIKDNGYKLLYLSARAIGQARITRDYLKSIRQGDLSMPDGPVLLNPTSLITAFHREVIEKKPEQFKISCMSDIKALFPTDSNPFYAGYGNRINDVWAYTAVGIPIVRIFTINPKGELKHELTQTFQSSYCGQSLVVNEVFPPIDYKLTDSDSEDQIDTDFSDSTIFD